MQISWMRWADRQSPRAVPELRCYDELGIAALRSQFFERTPAGHYVDPDKNLDTLRSQFHRNLSYVERVVSTWRGAPKNNLQSKLHIFGLGSAISSMVPSDMMPNRHLSKLSRAFIEKQFDDIFHELAVTYRECRQVRQMFRKERFLEADKSADGKIKYKHIESVLLKMFALPTIISLLERCEAEEIYFCEYDFVYGYYINKYCDESLPAPTAHEGEGPYVFVSYSHSDKSIAYRVIRQLQSRGYRIWYDQGIVGGRDWKDTVGHRICSCHLFLILMSSAAHSSKNVRSELSLADHYSKPIIEFRIRPIAELDPGIQMRLGSSLYIEWSSFNYDHIDRIEEALPQFCKAT